MPEEGNMSTPEAVLVCALLLLNRSAGSLPDITLVQRAPAHASPGVEAFVNTAERRIFLVTSTPLFETLRRADPITSELDLLRKLASIIVHEEWHVLHGPDERGAYEAQLMTLQLLGAGPGRVVYDSVHRSMLAVIRRSGRKPALVAHR
jgi:hypothetical protein